MPTNFQKAKRRTKLANGNWSDPISYATSSESVEMTDGTNLQTAMSNKVDKETGKGLSSNDYTDADKTAVLSLGTASTKDVNTNGNASASQVVMGNDTRLTDSRPASDVSAWAKASTKPSYTASEVGTYTSTEIDNKIDEAVSACYHPSGSKTCAELISSLLIADNEGNVYDMSDSGTTTSDFREGSGHPIKAGDNVGIVNVGTSQAPVYKFDLLSGFVDLSAYYTKTESDNKYVAKETGKGLSTNDYTTADKNKLANIEAEANKTVVDSAMSDSSTNPLQNKVITKELQGAQTLTGNPITVTDAAPVNAVNLSVDLEPVQDLHGYDHPWVGGAGKNKLPVTGSDETVSGIAYTNMLDNDGNIIGVKCVGTFSGTNPRAKYLSTNVTLPAGTYILTGGNGVTSTGIRLIATYTEGGTTKYADATSENGVTFTLSTETQVTFYLRGEQVNLAVDTIIYPMIRLSTETDSSFAPYTNYASISGRSEVAINRVGKNLCSEFVQGGYNGTTGAEIASTVYIRTGKIQIQPNTAYIFTREVNDGGEIYFWDKDLNFLSAEKISITWAVKQTPFTTPVNAKYCAMLIYKNGGITPSYITQPQLELGTTATTYEPYAGKTYTIQLGDTVYGAHLDATKGELVVDTAEVDLGDLTWSYNSNWNGYSAFFSTAITNIKKPPTASGAIMGALCSIYRERTRDYLYANNETAFCILADGRIGVRDSRYSSVSDYTAAVTGQQLVYELATPITIPLTPQQIKMLENTNTIYTDYEGDTIHIEYQPNNAIGEAVRVVEENYETRVSLLEDLNSSNAGFHNSIYRGKNLGTSVTTSQWLAIKNGTFEGLFIGDYWVINDITWRIAAFDYWMDVGENEYKTTKHHIVIVPDQYLVKSGYPMNTSETTAGGYIATQMHTQTIPQVIDPIVENAFGASHIMQHSEMITDQVTDGKSSKYTWVNGIKSELMNEIAVYGSRIFGSSGYDSGNARGQLPLFRLNPDLMILKSDFAKLWGLRDVYDAGYFCYVNGNGYADKHRANYNYMPIRPYFSIYQE